MPGFDYSKWDNLELSDDEDTFHPNIDNNLMIRINREQRARREQEEAKLRKKYEKTGDVEKLEQLEKNKKLHVDNICETKESRTIVNQVKEDKIPAKEVENFDQDEYGSFIKKNEKLLEEFTHATWEQSRDLMRIHGAILTHDHTHAWLLLGCLNAEMEGRRDDRNMLARQAEILSQLNELARTTGKPVLTRNVIGRYFDNMVDNPDTQRVFQEGVDAFVDRIKNRAVEKKKEMEAEAAAEAEEEAAAEGEETQQPVLLVDAMREMKPEDRMGPGGLDPVEVFDSLPPALQECFQSGDVQKLIGVAQSMPQEEFFNHFERCKKSGLWTEQPKQDGDEE